MKRPASVIETALRTRMQTLADPQRAQQQQAYMKSDMPFAGLTMPVLRRSCKEIFASNPLTSRKQWQATVLQLWRNADVREQRHAAIELLSYQPYQRRWQTPDTLPLIRRMIVEGAWWDFVDPLAINHVGALLRNYPAELQPLLTTWINNPDLWLRRAVILCQLKFKNDSNADFLYQAIEGSIRDKEFFARKAIGWALREYGKSQPQAVIDYVSVNSHRLSPLSQREALKVLVKQGLVSSVQSAIR